MYRAALSLALVAAPAQSACPDPSCEDSRWILTEGASGPVWIRTAPDGTIERRTPRAGTAGRGSRDADAGMPVRDRFAPGDILPGGFYVLTGTDRLGLPAPTEGWAYFKVDSQIYRVRIDSREIIERVAR